MLDLTHLTDTLPTLGLNGNRFGFATYPDGRVSIAISNNQIVTNDPILNDNQWHYLLGSYDGDTQALKLWIDGGLVASGTEAMSITLHDGQIRIGFTWPGRTPNMRIDDIMILPLAFDGEEFK